MSKFFEKIPIISYKGVPARNFLVRAQLDDSTKRNASLYHPYTLREEDRIDIVSHLYYNSPDYMWLIYLANDVIDPYYDVPLTQADFDNFIVKKYGSAQAAINTILFYRNNWASDESEYSVEQYNVFTTANPSLIKYYTPITNAFNNITGYRRKKEDWILATNKTVTANITAASGTLKPGARIKVLKESNNLLLGTATVTSCDESTLMLQHIDGFVPDKIWTETQNDNVKFIDQSTNEYVTGYSTFEVSSIPDQELPLWSAVTAYDYEHEQNEARKSIVLVENTFKVDLTDQLKQIMEN